MLGSGDCESPLQGFNAANGHRERLCAVGPIFAHAFGAIALDQLKCKRSVRIHGAGSRSALKVRLQDVRIVQNLEQLTLPDICGSNETSAIEAKPQRAVRTALIVDIVRIVTSGVDVGRPAVNAFYEFLLQLHASSVLEPDVRADGPRSGEVPWSILTNEILIRPDLRPAPPHTAKRCVKGGMPG